MLPKSLAQPAGLIVCAIVTLGLHLPLLQAMLAGAFTGALAIFFVSLAEARDNTRN